MHIGILGAGTLGHKLAVLATSGGHDVVVGVRDFSKVANLLPLKHASLAEAARFGDLVVLAIPYLACAEALPPLADTLAGKVVVDATNPLNPDWSPVPLGPMNSAGEEVARLLPRSSVVKAFNSVFADVMTSDRLDRDGRPATLFLCSDDSTARAAVSGFAASLGFAPVDAGPLSCARYLESMAHLNMSFPPKDGHLGCGVSDLGLVRCGGSRR